MTDKYILHGHTPLPEPDLYAWGRWFATAERHVADTWLTPEVRVSTVFLGVDHQWGAGPAILFETMVFGGAMDMEQQRYTTYHAAEMGHQAMVDRVQAALEHDA